MDLTVDTSVIMAVVLNEPSKAVVVEASRGAELVAPNSRNTLRPAPASGRHESGDSAASSHSGSSAT